MTYRSSGAPTGTAVRPGDGTVAVTVGRATDGTAARSLRVASTEPPRMRANPTPVVTVKRSSRNVTPSATATAGLTYVITVARAGPTSAMSWKKSRNATAV